MSNSNTLLQKPLDNSFISNRLNSSTLYLENGMAFKGASPEWQQGNFDGEVVFNTGMTGYDASLTDPSYAGQILVFTYPLIGNYGVPSEDQWESNKIYASGVVVSNVCTNWSHGKSLQSLLEWLKLQKVPLISGVDTRNLTKTLRDKGTMLGSISSLTKAPKTFHDPNKNSLADIVTSPKKTTYGSKGKKIIAVDCGMKANILRNLEKLPLIIHRVPYNYDYTKEDYDGVFLSNGPGNPEMYVETIAVLHKAIEKKKPIFGICLVAQLLSLAAGALTYKLTFGHRSHNQPCIDLESNRCYITSQNHGYAVCEKSLPKGWKVYFRNLNDGTVEGVKHATLPFSAVQFHPEAMPGPNDTEWLFKNFYDTL